ncbi:hypothetical protein AMTRI_Chr04g180880 [Amborella trichopoda]
MLKSIALLFHLCIQSLIFYNKIQENHLKHYSFNAIHKTSYTSFSVTKNIVRSFNASSTF